MSPRASAIFTLASVTIIGGFVAYAVYFDYKRRNDVSFRKQLKKDKKRVNKQAAQQEESTATPFTTEELRAALAKVRDEELPETPEAKEQYFMGHVGMGEQLCAQGPLFQLSAALSFYRALRVYPSPVELIMIYQKTVPENVFKVCLPLKTLETLSDTATDSHRTDQLGREYHFVVHRRGFPQGLGLLRRLHRRSGTGSPILEVNLRLCKTRYLPLCGDCSSYPKHPIILAYPLPYFWVGICPVSGYYDVFPRKSMNVSVQPAPGDATKLRKVVVAERDFSEGEVIYKELPLVAALDADLEGKGTHCSQCLRQIEGDNAVRPESDRLNSVYCSPECQTKAKVQWQNLLFGLDSVLPEDLDNGMSRLTRQQRDEAQTKFTAWLKEQDKSLPLLTARFVARQVALETAKVLPHQSGALADELAEATIAGDEYSLYDHMERLRFVDGNVSEEETKMLCDVLGAALPGLDKSLTDERHATYNGKLAYNAIGVVLGEGRDDRPTADRPEDETRTRTPHGTSRQVGSGYYPVSSYIAHSCAPSARPSFSSGNFELSLIAARPLEKGDEITIAWVDASQHADETAEGARRRRRFELARGWRFKCECSRCLEEATDGNESDMGIEKDESKVEDVVHRVETGTGGEAYLRSAPTNVD
ncbi:hypothetical protein IEO21_00889 [Rhodonia placenta]|uniref:SET domain-containing protein n=1 Tax=Rhodonia placenta TaxID=104341 RepID=A0A8H7PAW8_9APHY|nr:hypothetical protein IEO21_00889 [Postia placenta]